MKKHRYVYAAKLALQEVSSVSPILFWADITVALLTSFTGVAIVYATTALFEKIENASNGLSGPNAIWLAFFLFIFVYICRELIAWLSDHLYFRVSEHYIMAFSKKIHLKTSRLNAIEFENPQTINFIENASGGVYSIHYFASSIINLVLRDVPYLLFIGLYLLQIKPILFFVPILVFIPVVLSQMLRTKAFVTFKDNRASLDRKLAHYQACITDPAYFKETRMLGGFHFFKTRYSSTLEALHQEVWKLHVHSQTREVLSRLLTLGGYYGVLVLLFFTLMDGTITVGLFAAVFSSVQMLFTTVEHIVCNRIGSILMNDFSEINSYFAFMQLPEREYGQHEVKETNQIALECARFAYPSRDEYAIDGVDLHIKKGDVIAVVGENGSGKTTLARLLLSIYAPQSGVLSINGVNAEELTPGSLYNMKSAVFQQYYRYLFRLRSNITISDYNRDDLEGLKSASGKAGVFYEDKSLFPQGYETVLSKKFGGVDLSGGEWQRVAIARGLYKNSDFIVLDEPTAAVDPLEESEIYKKFLEVIEGKTAVIITHRLAAAKLADTIIVMQAGKIIQVGNHEALVSCEGLYRELYTIQSEWYK